MVLCKSKLPTSAASWGCKISMGTSEQQASEERIRTALNRGNSEDRKRRPKNEKEANQPQSTPYPTETKPERAEKAREAHEREKPKKERPLA